MAEAIASATALHRGYAARYAYDPLGGCYGRISLGAETFAFDPASNIVAATERDEQGIGLLGGARSAPLLDNLLKEYADTHFEYDEPDQAGVSFTPIAQATGPAVLAGGVERSGPSLTSFA